MNKAIKLAIEKGGYLAEYYEPLDTIEVWSDNITIVDRTGRQTYFGASKALLDPTFWQALGKALGWDENGPYPFLWHWHNFIDHIAEGKSSDEFFKDLINPNKV